MPCRAPVGRSRRGSSRWGRAASTRSSRPRSAPPATADEPVLARGVRRDGRSRAYLDGRLATVGELAEAGRALVDLHGQHAHQSLLDPAVQRGALDRYAGPSALEPLARYRAARATARDLDAELAALGGDARA